MRVEKRYINDRQDAIRILDIFWDTFSENTYNETPFLGYAPERNYKRIYRKKNGKAYMPEYGDTHFGEIIVYKGSKLTCIEYRTYTWNKLGKEVAEKLSDSFNYEDAEYFLHNGVEYHFSDFREYTQKIIPLIGKRVYYRQFIIVPTDIWDDFEDMVEPRYDEEQHYSKIPRSSMTKLNTLKIEEQ